MRKFGLAIYAFYLMYRPNLKSYVLLDNNIMLIILLLILLIPYILKRDNSVLSNLKKKPMSTVFIFTLISSIYFAIRSQINIDALDFGATRLIQSLLPIIYLLHVSILYDKFKKMKFTYQEMLEFIIKIGVFQGIICLFMIAFPSLKNIALQLYYGGQTENVFISANRIYGIATDYTFGFQIMHGLLATVAFCYSILYKRKYLLAVPFIFLVTILNGRTGIIIFVSTMITSTVIIMYKYSVVKTIRQIFLIVLFVSLLIFIVYMYTPNTFNFIYSGVEQSINLFLGQGEIGNYDLLFDRMLYFPESFTAMFLGEGHRVFASEAISHGYLPSDIGYVNDVFMGGIVYTLLLYIPVISYLSYKNKNANTIQQKCLNTTFTVAAILTFLITNYKGEIMRNTTTLMFLFMMKFLIIDLGGSKDEKWNTNIS